MGIHETGDARDTVSTRAVLDDHRLSPSPGKPLREQARGEIGSETGREGAQ
jgi:hypothetical protein